MKNVSEAEFYSFIHAYPGLLDSRVVTIGEPPSVIYYELGTKKVIGRIILNENDPRSLIKNEYEIAE